MRHRERRYWGGLSLWAAVIAALELWPRVRPSTVPFLSVFASYEAGADIAQNVLLYVPLGWCLRRLGLGFGSTLVIAGVTAGGIECAQLLVPGRATTIGDIAAKVAGALLAWRAAAPVVHRGMRATAAFLGLAIMLAMHALNTSWWPLRDVTTGTFGMWSDLSPRSGCDSLGGEALCYTVRWSGGALPAGLTLVELPARSLAWMRATDARCVDVLFVTRGSLLRLQPPYTRLCDLPGEGEAMELTLSPRLERACSRVGECRWAPVPASGFLRPIWFERASRPRVLLLAGALSFVVGASLFAGTASWVFPAGYLIALMIAAAVAGFRGPTPWDCAAAFVAWMVASVLLWMRTTGVTRQESPAPDDVPPAVT